MPPPIPRDQARADADHLNLLSIFHFVCAGLAVLGILIIIAQYAMFNEFINHPQTFQKMQVPNQPQFPVNVFGMFKWIYLFGAIWCVSSGILNLISGFYIRARKHRTFSQVVAVVNCLHIPLGTVLGVFTLIVLSRDSVRALYRN